MSCSPEPDSLVAESAEFRQRAEHLVEYTHSKSTIEQLMQQLPYAAAGHCPPFYRGGPYSSRLPAFQQYFLGIQHGPDAAEIPMFMEDRIDVIPVDYCATTPC
jgi:hypothetical protein